MIVLEYKVKGKQHQYNAIDDAIRTTQLIRNEAIRHWMDAPRQLKIDKFALNQYSTELRGCLRSVIFNLDPPLPPLLSGE